MKIAAKPDSEENRIAALQALDILDSAPELEFDALVRIAHLICGVPISLISLVDTERQWFKANIGLPGVAETPRDVAFCSHAILQEQLFEIPDASVDDRFSDNPLVAGSPDIRFYAGAPIVLSNGHRVGTLCVIDRKPRQLDENQREVLKNLAIAAAASLEGRQALRKVNAVAAQLKESDERLRRLYEATPAMMHSIDASGRLVSVSDVWLNKLGYTRTEVLGCYTSDFMTPASRDYAKKQVLPAFFETGRCDDIEYQMVSKNGQIFDVLLSGILDRGSKPELDRSLAVLEDVTERKLIERALANKRQRLAYIIESTHAGTWEWNVITGEVIINARWAEILGETLQSLCPVSERTWRERGHPDDLREMDELLKQHFEDSGHVYEIEVRMRHRDGHWIWVLTRGQIMTRTADAQPEWMFGIHEDVTSRVMARNALNEATERAALATDSGHIGIWDWDVSANTVMWDSWMHRLYGYPATEGSVSYEFWTQHVLPEDLTRIEEELKTAIESGTRYDTEFRIFWADRTEHHIHVTSVITRDNCGQALRMIGTSQDVTIARKLAAELAEQHELLQVTLRSIGDAVITTDAKGNVVWLNPVAERMTGWLTSEALGRPLGQVFNIVNEETRRPTENPVLACIEQGKIVGLANHTVLISRDGDEFGIEDSAAPIRNAAGDMLGVVLVFHDVTEQRRLSGEMSYRASHDALTGLVNRAEFETRLRRLLQKAYEERSEHSLLYIDLDQFKLVNDSCGHAIGDQLLQQVSKLLLGSIRDRDTLARLGGDEFAIILEHCNAEAAHRVAQEICDRMDDFRFIHDGRRFRIGASIGLVPVDSRWATTENIMQAADTSCYAAKEAGRNRLHAWFDSDLAMRTRHGEMQWTDRIGHALDEDMFVLFAQRIHPINRQPAGLHAEVLLRMVDTDGSLIPPCAFLPAAERFQLVSRIDRWVLKRTIEHLQSLKSLAGISNISINLSGQSIGDRAFHRWAIELLLQAGPDICQLLCLEITETAVVTNLADAVLFIEQVHAVGLKIALDDFGAGASSFGYLKALKVDFLKIDGQFIRNLVDNPLDQAAVRCFADVAKVVDVLTVAEFVEFPEVLERLRIMGIDYAQGFLKHRPEAIQILLDDSIHAVNCPEL